MRELLMEPDTRPVWERAFPCCRHCTHKQCQCDPACDFEGHPTPCSRCAQYQAWVSFFGRELADTLEQL